MTISAVVGNSNHAPVVTLLENIVVTKGDGKIIYY